MTSAQSVLGSIVSLWRYPVKSMMGEELNSAEVTKGGLIADRAFALMDRSDGKIATAKNPRKWPLFDFRGHDHLKFQRFSRLFELAHFHWTSRATLCRDC